MILEAGWGEDYSSAKSIFSGPFFRLVNNPG